MQIVQDGEETPKKAWGGSRYLGVLVLLVAIAYLVWRWRAGGFDLDEFWRTLLSADPWWLVAAACFELGTLILRGVRWRQMIDPLRPGALLRPVVDATIIGYTAVILTGRPGEVVRPWLIAKRQKMTYASQGAIWLLERVFDGLVVFGSFGAALAIAADRSFAASKAWRWALETGGWIAAAGCLICGAFLLAAGRHGRSAEEKLLESLSAWWPGKGAKLQRWLAGLGDGFVVLETRGEALRLFLSSVAVWLVTFAVFRCVCLAVPATRGLSLLETFILATFVTLGGIVQIPGIGGGFQVTIAVILTEMFHLSLEEAAGFAVVAWVSTILVIIPFGVALAVHEGVKFSKLKQIEEEARL